MKRFIALILASAMAFAVPVFGAEASESSVQKGYAEEYAKKAEDIFGITSNDYHYQFYKDDDNSYMYIITWEGTCSVIFDSDGNISGYSSYTYDEETKGTPITKEQAEETALNYLKKITGRDCGEMKIYSVEHYSSTDNWCIDFCEYRGDYKVTYNYANMELSCDGKIQYYYASNMCNTKLSGEENMMTYEQARAKFIENVGFGKAYVESYSFDGAELNALFTETSHCYIDAVNGEKIPEGRGDVFSAAAAADEEASGESGLSEAEQNSLDNLGKALSAEKSAEIIKNVLGYEFDVNSLKTSNFADENGVYYTQITDISRYSTACVSQNGEISSFDNYGADDTELKEKLTFEVLKNKSADILTRAGQKDYELTDYLQYDESTYFEYNKIINDAVSFPDRIGITLKNDGTILSYWAYTHKNYEYPETSSDITNEQAFDKCADAFGFTPKYIWDADKKTGILVYSFDENPYLSLDGRPVTYSGEDYYRDFDEYTDIEGSPYKEYIEKLFNLNIKTPTSEFEPEKTLTYEDFYALMPNTGYFNENDFDNEHNLTKYELAKLFCYSLGIDDFAVNSSLYKTSYNDVYGENLPYVALCEVLGIFNSTVTDGNEGFNGNSTVTRGQFAEMLCNYFKAENALNGNGVELAE